MSLPSEFGVTLLFETIGTVAPSSSSPLYERDKTVARVQRTVEGPLSFPIRGRPIDARNQALHVRTTFGLCVRTSGLAGSVGCPDFRGRLQKIAKYGHLAPGRPGASMPSGRLAPVGSFSRPWCPDFHPAQTPFLTLHVRTFGHPDGQNRSAPSGLSDGLL